MGTTQVTVTIRHPAEPHKTWEGLFLVDTAATEKTTRCTPQELADEIEI